MVSSRSEMYWYLCWHHEGPSCKRLYRGRDETGGRCENVVEWFELVCGV